MGYMMDETAPCPDCQVAPGQLHEDGCDVARCKNTGSQRLMQGCSRNKPCQGSLLFADCRTRWLGQWPGIAECQELGWYARLVPPNGWQPCGPEDEGAVEDMNRLITEGVRIGGLIQWDPYAEAYRLRGSSV